MKHLPVIPLGRKARQRIRGKRIRALHICMAIILMFTAVFSGMALSSANVKAATKKKVLVAYFGRYDNTDFSKDVGGSGQSGTYKKIQKLCSGADLLPGLAVSDEDVTTKATQKKLKSWLNKIDVKSRSAKTVPITINIGDRTFDGVCYDTALGRQMMKKFPLSVTMDEFGGREYYGEVEEKDRPTKRSKGKLAFVNGDITYCFENDTMAIFYNQSDSPDLTMRVNCIGRVTGDLSSFRTLGESVEVIFDLKK